MTGAMRTVCGSKSIARAAIFAGAGLLAVLPSHGQERLVIQDSQHSTGMVNDAEVAAVFDRRWDGGETEFVIGADGVAKAYAAEGRAEDNSEHIAAGVVPAPGKGNLSQYAIDSGTGQSDADVARCGPSPLNQTEIRELVVMAAARHGVDRLFAEAIAWAESDFDRLRNSPKGARGPMQLMPGTAKRFEVGDVCDPASNIEGGMRYLRVLLDEFENPLLVAAAYNAGEARIYEYGGIPPFRETVGYVAKVVNYQLGLPMPRAKGAARQVSSASSGNADGAVETGVIGVKKSGQFVGGVMHF